MIYFIEAGKIVGDSGSYDELIKTNANFKVYQKFHNIL